MKKMTCQMLVIIGLIAAIESRAADQPAALLAPVSGEAVERWRAMRFGMFIHWGPVSLKGTEIGWSRGSQVPVEEYDNLYKQFNPVKFNADEWVSTAKAAGMKYIVLTTKHHDGFCLWDTKQTAYNIMNTPFKRDVTKELAAACKKQGLAFGAYYSTCDWYHPDFPQTSPGGKTKREKSDLEAYTKYLKAQISELLKNYGPLLTLWFDVPQQFDAARGAGVINLARSIQPDILINNRTGAKGDYDTPEQRVGGYNIDRPWETCMTICHQWAWKPNDKMKSLEECIRTLVMSNGGDGNLLFNVGPSPEGEIESGQIGRLKEMGAWLEKYGESIYGTRGGPFAPTRRYAATRKGNAVYLHLFKWNGDSITLPPLKGKIISSSVLTGGKAVVENSEHALKVALPKAYQQSIVTVLKFQMDRDSMAIPFIPAEAGSRAIASDCALPTNKFAAQMAVDDNTDTRWEATAESKTPWLEIDLLKSKVLTGVLIDEGGGRRVKKFSIARKIGQSWETILQAGEMGGQYNPFRKEFNAPVEARYVRVNIEETQGAASIAEIAFTEKETK